MKYIIIGLHSSGKQEVLDQLEDLDIKCGKLFSNIKDTTPELYNSCNYELYSAQDINEIFENNAYIFMQELQSESIHQADKYYEGLSKYTFDNSDVVALSPDQLLCISPTVINERVCFIWMDNTKTNRKSRYNSEKRSYNFNDRESIESCQIQSFVKCVYGFNDSDIIYFANEEPERVATILYSIIKHPDLYDQYVKNFS